MMAIFFIGSISGRHELLQQRHRQPVLFFGTHGHAQAIGQSIAGNAAQDDAADSSKGDNPDWRAGAAGGISATVNVKRWNAEHWVVSVVTPETGYAVLRLMDYPSWRVTLDGRPMQGRPVRDDGLMTVPVTAGNHVVEVQWATTRDVLAGRLVSAISLLALAIVGMLERRERRV